MRTTKKRGEMTSTQIVTVILGIIGLVIIGAVVWASHDAINSKKEACKLSILERATVPGVLESDIPLKCTTEKVCITSQKNGECKQFAGEKNIRKVIIKTTKDAGEQRKTKAIMEKEIADGMFDCWSMTGRGQLDIFTAGDNQLKNIASLTGITADDIRPQCIICTRVAIAEDVYWEDKEKTTKNQAGQQIINSLDVNKYLFTQEVPGTGKTYFEHFLGSNQAGTYAEYSVDESKHANEQISNNNPETNGTDHLAILFMQIKIKDEKGGEAFWNAAKAGIAIGGATALSPAGGLIKFVAGTPGAVIATAIGAGAVFSLASSAEQATNQNQLAAAMVCQDKMQSFAETDKKGCSIVRAVKWDTKTINDLCYGIQGNL